MFTSASTQLHFCLTETTYHPSVFVFCVWIPAIIKVHCYTFLSAHFRGAVQMLNCGIIPKMVLSQNIHLCLDHPTGMTLNSQAASVQWKWFYMTACKLLVEDTLWVNSRLAIQIIQP